MGPTGPKGNSREMERERVGDAGVPTALHQHRVLLCRAVEFLYLLAQNTGRRGINSVLLLCGGAV